MPRDATPDRRPGDRRGARRLATVLAALVAALALAGLVTRTDPVAAGAAAPPATEPAEQSTPPGQNAASVGASADTAPATTSFNDFIPENANLSDCISALPGPNCGSEARGGWPQLLVFGVIAAAMVGIGTRIVISVRRRDREHNAV